MKGITTIELTDIHTGKKEVYQEENMITNALRDIYAFFPQLYSYKDFNAQTGILHENLLGGIKLFDHSLTEDKDNYYLPSVKTAKVVGYASNDTSDGTDVRRGSRNIAESKAIDGGYQFVWDFATSEANGTIASLSLTTAEGGKHSWLPTKTPSSDLWNTAYMAANLAEINLEEGWFVTLYYESNTIRIRRYSFLYDHMTLERNLFVSKLESDDTISITPPFNSSYRNFRDGGDGYWYYVYTNGNYQTQKPSKVYVEKVDKNTLAYTYQTLELENTIVAPSSSWNHFVWKGYLYLNKLVDGATSTSSNARGFYKVNLNNLADVELIDFEEWTKTPPSYTHISPGPNGMLFANGILFDGQEKEVFFKNYAVNNAYYYGSTSSFYYYCNYVQYSQKARSLLRRYYSSSYYEMDLAIDREVLMTINNLSSPVMKTADKTMKITYTLMYEE